MKIGALLIASICVCLPPWAFSSDASKQQEGLKAIEDAVAHTNIFELSSFRFKANVQVEIQGKHTEGIYQLLWNGPEQWREEIHLPQYDEIKVGEKERVWTQRSTDFLPLRIHDLRTALGFGPGSLGLGGSWASLVQPGVTPKDSVKKVEKRNVGGEAQTCVVYEDRAKRHQEICVDDQTNMIVRDAQSFLDRDIQPVGGGKVYPRVLSLIEKGTTTAKVNVTEITSPATFPPSSFAPPSGSSAQVGCMNPSSPHLVKRTVPTYPQGALQQHLQGRVAVDASIGTDGVPKIGKVVGRAAGELEQSALSAIKEWRYEPAICNGKPVELETVIRVDYSLRP
jgi:TonB family protein